ncbi:NUDIX domain-containing protein [Micromonospora krabiensis]|uniref:8-oxo-dGTP diphosphatase n=1 Tax=Micromonospora krabiensis TaxID=307121 RepID=A0A1C3N8Y8_9ACTN|nr:NUDIX domain-containing protein [Micromonospora krabiensis]SBV29039.1 NUDIX domain-containing protein [Micromonospora krabiensis]
MHVVVTGALVENDAVLLVHRSPTRRAYPDRWDLPGGHVEASESELQALAREMREEVGVRIVAESRSRLGDLHAGSGEDAVHVGVWHIGDWAGAPKHPRGAWVVTMDVPAEPLPARLLARGGLTYVDRRDFIRGDLTVIRRLRWPSVGLWVEDSTLTLSSRAGSDALHHSEVTAVPHGPYLGWLPSPALAVSFQVEDRDQVLLFWTPRARAVIRRLAQLGWDADPDADDFV